PESEDELEDGADVHPKAKGKSVHRRKVVQDSDEEEPDYDNQPGTDVDDEDASAGGQSDEEQDVADLDLEGMDDEALGRTLNREHLQIVRRTQEEMQEEESSPLLEPVRLANADDVANELSKNRKGHSASKQLPYVHVPSKPKPKMPVSTSQPKSLRQRPSTAHDDRVEQRAARSDRPSESSRNAGQLTRRDQAMIAERPEVSLSRRRRHGDRDKPSASNPPDAPSRKWSPDTDLVLNRISRMCIKSQTPAVTLIGYRAIDSFILDACFGHAYPDADERLSHYHQLLLNAANSVIKQHDEPVFYEIRERIRTNIEYAKPIIEMARMRVNILRAEIKDECKVYVREEYKVSQDDVDRVKFWTDNLSYIYPGNVE
ncbi:hypothetical protein K474DRAFT_1710798, partial [Panus rudis PR-1116 ss-1]